MKKTTWLIGAIAAATQAVPTAAAIQANPSGWVVTEAIQEGVIKLQHFPGDSPHGDVYVFCRPEGEGFVHLGTAAHDRSGTLTLSAGRETLSAPARYSGDPHYEGDYVAVMVPANHGVLRAMGDGHALRVGAATYPVHSERERRAVREFIRLCDIPDDED